MSAEAVPFASSVLQYLWKSDAGELHHSIPQGQGGDAVVVFSGWRSCIAGMCTRRLELAAHLFGFLTTLACVKTRMCGADPLFFGEGFVEVCRHQCPRWQICISAGGRPAVCDALEGSARSQPESQSVARIVGANGQTRHQAVRC